MNDGVLTSGHQPPPTPYGLLGNPTPVPIPDFRTLQDPRTIAGLQIWLDSGDSSTVLNSISPDTPASIGQTVRRWLDKSGLGRHAEQATGANQPTLGERGIQFNGNNSFLLLPNARAVISNIRYMAVFAAYSLSSSATANARTVMFFGTPAQFFVRSVLRINPTNAPNLGARRLDADGQQQITSADSVAVGSVFVHSGIFNYGNASAALRVNGQTKGQSSPFLTAGATSDSLSAGVSIGIVADFNQNTFGGWAPADIREILVYTGTALTADATLTIERYLGRRWGAAVA